MQYEKMVSVVIAVYNMERYLDKCIESIMKQSFNDYEVILVNDGSVDNSEKIIDKYVELNPQIFKKINKTNGGLSSARNISFDYIKGKYVTFLDADDYYDKEYLKTLIDKAEKDGLDMVCSGQHKITEDGIILKTISYKLKDGYCLQRRLNISGKLYKTDYIRKWNINFPEGKTYEDNSFNLQAFYLSPKIGFLEYEGYYQVVHEGSITSKPIDSSKLPFEEWEKVVRKVHEAHVQGVDIEHFDFIFMSFATYFLMVRNRKREYLSNENKNASMDSVYKICAFFEKVVNEQFNNYQKNIYTHIFKYRELPLTQKVGTRVFYSFAKRNKLKTLVNMLYKFS